MNPYMFLFLNAALCLLFAIATAVMASSENKNSAAGCFLTLALVFMLLGELGYAAYALMDMK